MTKLLENTHRALNISLVKGLKMVTDGIGNDVLEIVNAAASKLFDFTPYSLLPGSGGNCISIDSFAFTWKAKEFGIHKHFVEWTGEIDFGMPE